MADANIWQNETASREIGLSEEQTPKNDAEIEARRADLFIESLDALRADDVSPELARRLRAKKKKKRRGAVTSAVIVLLCLAILSFSVFEVVSIVADYNRARVLYDEYADGFERALLAPLPVEPTLRQSPMSPDSALMKYSEVLVNGAQVYDPPSNGVTYIPTLRFQRVLAYLETLRQKNGETFGFISIERKGNPSVDIKYPIVQTTDNDFYLNHGFDGQKLNSGTIFVDYRNAPTVTANRNLVIYGHNMWNTSSMFHELDAFFNEAAFNDTQIEIFAFDGIYIFEVFAVYKAVNTERYFRTEFFSDEDFVDFCNYYKNMSVFQKDGITFDKDDVVLTLSTCDTDGTNDLYRYVVQAKLVSVEN